MQKENLFLFIKKYIKLVKINHVCYLVMIFFIFCCCYCQSTRQFFILLIKKKKKKVLLCICILSLFTHCKRAIKKYIKLIKINHVCYLLMNFLLIFLCCYKLPMYMAILYIPNLKKSIIVHL